ncbi:hypothetical protein ACKVM7_000274 [Arthrobacter russicus]
MTTHELPRLIFTPWGYISEGLALLNYQNQVPHPQTSRYFDATTHTYIIVDWTIPGAVEEAIGIPQAPADERRGKR